MPSVKIPRKSTATDMTPFVDVAFLILSFFMLATKFKPPEAVPITTPKSVSVEKLKETNSVMVNFDSTGRVFFAMNVEKSDNRDILLNVIKKINDTRKLGLSQTEMNNFQRNTSVGVPFRELKALLATPMEGRTSFKSSGIPVDSTNNELSEWIGAAKAAFNEKDDKLSVSYMIKGDNNAKYPSFNGVLEAMRRNDQFNFKLVTDPEAVPAGTALYKIRETPNSK